VAGYRLGLNLELQEGETVTIDTELGQISCSTIAPPFAFGKVGATGAQVGVARQPREPTRRATGRETEPVQGRPWSPA